MRASATIVCANPDEQRKDAADRAAIVADKVKEDAKYDGKWVLITNTDMPADEVAVKSKELWQVEAIFRETKSVLETRQSTTKTTLPSAAMSS